MPSFTRSSGVRIEAPAGVRIVDIVPATPHVPLRLLGARAVRSPTF